MERFFYFQLIFGGQRPDSGGVAERKSGMWLSPSPAEKTARFVEFIPISRLSCPGTTDRPPSDGSGPGPEFRGKTFGRQPFPPILPLYLPGETGAFFA